MIAMKFVKQTLLLLSACCLLTACDKDKLGRYNTDPDAVISLDPDLLFTRAIINIHDNDFEAFYDNYSYISRWSRVFLQRSGNSIDITQNASNANHRYAKFFEDSGPILIDIQQLIDKLPAEQQARLIYKRAIPTILKVYQYWYVSDVNGSLPYKEAFQARYQGTLTPKYETQDELYHLFDADLKEAATILNTVQKEEQLSYGQADLYFQGDAKKWAKAANSMRLLIALRLSKRDPERVKTIVKEVLNHPAGLIENPAESWVFKARAGFTAGGNWNISGNGRAFVGEHGVVDYMWETKDPRLQLFFKENMWNVENFEEAKVQEVIPQNAVFDERRYYGQFSNPSANKDPKKARFLRPLSIKKGKNTLFLDTVSRIQDRLFHPDNNGGKGSGIFPILTYADLCFIRAELAQRGWSSEQPKEWYDKGVRASLDFYNELAMRAQIEPYNPLTSLDIDEFLQQPDIVFQPAKGLEQIVLQAYLNYFRNFNEAWALIKRTGMPNEQTRLSFEPWKDEERILEMPRRFPINYPGIGDYNFENKKNALDEMVKDPDFGLPSSIQGRVWWDKK